MFISKKNAEYLNKPTKGKKIQIRVLPGWDDNEDNQTTKQFHAQYGSNNGFKNVQTNLLGQNQPLFEIDTTKQKPNKQTKNKKSLYSWDQLNDMNNIQCEKRLVENIVEPVGVKVKPPQNLLNQFVKQSKSMEPVIVGSLLLSKLSENYPFLVKAKSLYTIQYLVKKISSFANYFKVHTDLIKGFQQPEQNVQNYRKILKSVLNTIGVTSQKTQQKQQNGSQQITFVDPGYNDHKEQSQIKGFLQNNEKTKKPVGPSNRKFISPNQAKKSIQVTQSQKNDIFDIFGDSSVSTNGVKSSQSGLQNLISINEPIKKYQNVKFDDLLK